MTTLTTDRLCLRPWRDDDLAPFADLNADPEVRRYFGGTQTSAESDASAAPIRARLAERGWGMWAVEIPDRVSFIGFVGLNGVDFGLPFTPAVEIGWRLARAYWGQGYAPEAARAALQYGFDELSLAEIVSFTTVANAPSRRVMEKLGMVRNSADDFDHPKLVDGDPLRRHVLYRLTKRQWDGA